MLLILRTWAVWARDRKLGIGLAIFYIGLVIPIYINMSIFLKSLGRKFGFAPLKFTPYSLPTFLKLWMLSLVFLDVPWRGPVIVCMLIGSCSCHSTLVGFQPYPPIPGSTSNFTGFVQGVCSVMILKGYRSCTCSNYFVMNRDLRTLNSYIWGKLRFDEIGLWRR